MTEIWWTHWDWNLTMSVLKCVSNVFVLVITVVVKGEGLEFGQNDPQDTLPDQGSGDRISYPRK